MIAKRPSSAIASRAARAARVAGGKATISRAGKASTVPHILVRMYNVGFGDCFLIKVPGADRERKILLDCGSIAHGPRKLSTIVRDLIDEVRESDGTPRLDVVIATHRHRDHVSGFDNELWRTVAVKEVWMPWTEHPTDAKAKEIREKQSNLAAALSLSLTTRLAGADGTERERIARLQEIVSNALSNEAAMRTLHRGFAEKPSHRFLSSNRDGGRFQTDALPDTVIHVLGPSEDKDVIRDMAPPEGESYLRLVLSSKPGTQVKPPFGVEWVLDKEDEHPFASQGLSPEDMQRIEAIGSEDDLMLTVALEKAVNGTSLMLALEIGDACLLLPGDAQWGTWNAALKVPANRELLRRTTFLKVGHHGSHNATPRDFVEDVLGKQVLAMISTRPVKQWPNIPREPLLEALERKKIKMARSDRPSEAPSAFTTMNETYLEAQIPVKL